MSEFKLLDVAQSISILSSVVERLEDHRFSRSEIDWPAVKDSLDRAKSEAIAGSDQSAAKAAWCLETIMGILRKYEDAFADLRRGEFYEAWCAFEQCEILIHFLDQHFDDSRGQFGVEFIRQQVVRFQGLYPYRLFLSPEILYRDIRCSVCDSLVVPRSHCGHEVGEIYDGVMCGRVIRQADILGISLVEHPHQKYSVPFLKDEVSGESRDHYDYSLIEYVIKGLRNVWDEWDYSWEQAWHPHERFKHVGRNDPCPCESGKKYKLCCLRQPGVLRPHCVIQFSVSPPDDLPAVVFTNDLMRHERHYGNEPTSTLTGAILDGLR